MAVLNESFNVLNHRQIVAFLAKVFALQQANTDHPFIKTGKCFLKESSKALNGQAYHVISLVPVSLNLISLILS